MNSPSSRVLPAVEVDAAADVGLDGRGAADWERADRDAERHDAEPRRLLDVGAVEIGEVGVEAVAGLRVVADADAGFDEVAQPEQHFAANRRAGEELDGILVADVVPERAEAVPEAEGLVEHVAGRSTVFAARNEAPEGAAEERVGRRNRRSSGKGRDEERGNENGATHEDNLRWSETR